MRDSGSAISVTVVFAKPDVEAIVSLEVAAGTSLIEAVEASGLLARHGLDAARISFAVFGEQASAQTPLADGDRVELLRPLLADAKETRRRRAHENPLPKPHPGLKRRKSIGKPAK